MNCLDFHRAIGTTPRQLDPAALAHRSTCRRCQEAHERALAFERRLVDALAIPVPDNLAEQILLRQTTSVLHQARSPHRVWRWLAATAALVLALSFPVIGYWRTVHAPLAELAIDHLAAEPFALSAHAEIEPERVRALFAALGAPIASSPGAVHYLNRCRIGWHRSIHIVMQRASGPVTVLYVPTRREARHEFHGVGVQGLATPIGRGTLILLATDRREFDRIEAQFQRAFAGGDGSVTAVP